METQSVQEQTINSLMKQFLLDFNKESRDQIKNMIFIAICFCRCFEDTKEEIAELKKMFKDPLRYIIESDAEYFSNEQIKRLLRLNQKLGRIEWIYFRDTHRFTKLNTEYYKEENTPQRQKHFNTGEVLDTRDYIKMRVSEIFWDVVFAHGVTVDPMLLPNMDGSAPIKQVGVEDFERRNP